MGKGSARLRLRGTDESVRRHTSIIQDLILADNPEVTGSV